MTHHTTTVTDSDPGTPSRGSRIILAGAALDNDNRGVEALGTSVVAHLTRSPTVDRVSVLDDGWGVRPDHGWTQVATRVERVGVRNSRRWHRRESWARIRFDQALGGLGNPVLGRLTEADAVADLSGGDSFTDLYGPFRLATICAPKEAAIRAGRPLVLLPQTFGPFSTVDGRRRAERIVRATALAYSRDEWSHDRLLELAGPDVDPARLRRGVDVAFGLRPQEPDAAIVARLTTLAGEPVVGVNVSGLLRDADAARRFGLAGDYIATLTAVVRALVAAGAFVVLVSHVHGSDPKENDAAALDRVRASLDERDRQRVWRLSPRLRAAELKWCIARMDWFTGSRMHATIAALSSGVPTFGYAYSDKTHGVFGTCGVADHVTDARSVTGLEVVERALDSFAARDTTRRALAANVPAVVDRAHGQLDEVLGAVTAWRGSDAVGVVA
ncbi:polysaccharide pyruvyl transferase family protein [Georgenia sp. H159]|uniref:polysaccharide pyruvyl transferase family protein n=1 Tax=Georgenia sp. H159 TaxID=3076115 RepID=UPI002D77CD41|nr:polysaccharide pyruvyl transferase family protein [Georgenia sp. H159]